MDSLLYSQTQNVLMQIRHQQTLEMDRELLALPLVVHLSAALHKSSSMPTLKNRIDNVYYSR
jgi:hypothetical protein